jgi:prophage DNA circulation protein
MNPIEASSILATLVGLICNWSQERSGQAEDRFQDFMVWLSHHHFEGLRERIFDSEELQRDLTSLLQQDLSVLGSRLDTITGAISAVVDKIDSLSQVGRALGTDTEALSDQAVEVLKVFDQMAASRMVVFDHEPVCLFLPNRMSATFSDARFLETDVTALESMGFIRMVDQNKSGNPIYAITRAGSAYAATLPAVPL